jgi:hypothetical protein
MFCRQFARVVRQDYNAAARRVRTTSFSFAKFNLAPSSIRLYSASGKSTISSFKSKGSDDAIREMDFDATEAMLKDRLGDHANWSHEQLLSLMICKLQHPRDRLILAKRAQLKTSYQCMNLCASGIMLQPGVSQMAPNLRFH